jgi:hypothetical protein
VSNLHDLNRSEINTWIIFGSQSDKTAQTVGKIICQETTGQGMLQLTASRMDRGANSKTSVLGYRQDIVMKINSNLKAVQKQVTMF